MEELKANDNAAGRSVRGSVFNTAGVVRPAIDIAFEIVCFGDIRI